MSDQTAVPTAIFQLLSNDTELHALLSAPDAVYPDFAPEGAVYPYVIFGPLPGVLSWAFRSFARNQLWLVKGVCRGGDAEPARAIDARCEKLLNDAQLVIEGSHLLYLRRESDVPQSEIDGGDLITESGGLYRVMTEAAA